MSLCETARAKINLTLRVLGRRADGYHEIESLVAFADIGDALSLEPGERLDLRTGGPFAAAIGERNLVLQAAERVLRRWPSARAGAFHLDKQLPVAAGIGGGSADAAAALRLLARANPGIVPDQELPRIAAALGADVPACLESRASFIRGIGDVVSPLSAFPAVFAVLANPGIGVPTADVFAALAAPPVPGEIGAGGNEISFGSVRALAAWVAGQGNDLEVPSAAIAPVAGTVKAAIAALPGCLAAGMSGSGATCFGLFARAEDAAAAAAVLVAAHPDWWIRPAALF